MRRTADPLYPGSNPGPGLYSGVLVVICFDTFNFRFKASVELMSIGFLNCW